MPLCALKTIATVSTAGNTLNAPRAIPQNDEPDIVGTSSAVNPTFQLDVLTVVVTGLNIADEDVLLHERPA